MQTPAFEQRLLRLLRSDRQFHGYILAAPFVSAREVQSASVSREHQVLAALQKTMDKDAGPEKAVDGTAGRASSIGFGVILVASALSVTVSGFFLNGANDDNSYERAGASSNDEEGGESEALPLADVQQYHYSGRQRHSDTRISFGDFGDSGDHIYAGGISTTGFNEPDSPPQ